MSDLTVLRIDDLPLLYAEVEALEIQEMIDTQITPHGNRTGLSLGHLFSLWICYLLSQSDHKLSPVEDWAADHEVLLKSLSGQYGLSSKDFTDDRLEQALDYLSEEAHWLGISNGLNRRNLEVYSLDPHQSVRLDAAPMQGHHQIKQGGLFQYGYSKHHNSDLGQLKVKLACVDNALNGFGYPLAHLVVSGEQADDGLYIPLIAQCEQTFAHAAHQGRKLYVGDGKMGSGAIRDYIVEGGNDYLMPLPKKQLSETERAKAIGSVDQLSYEKVYKTDSSGQQILVAQGFERVMARSYIREEKTYDYSERQVFVLSSAYAKSARAALDRRLGEAQQALSQLLTPKKGNICPKPEQNWIRKSKSWWLKKASKTSW